MDNFRQSLVTYCPENQLTKHQILLNIARIFHLLQSVPPVTIDAKALMQRIWQVEIRWDTPWEDILNAWKNTGPNYRKWKFAMYLVGSVTLKNCRVYHTNSMMRRVRIRWNYLQQAVPLLCASIRVIPLKTKLTLPRLELHFCKNGKSQKNSRRWFLNGGLLMNKSSSVGVTYDNFVMLLCCKFASEGVVNWLCSCVSCLQSIAADG